MFQGLTLDGATVLTTLALSASLAVGCGGNVVYETGEGTGGGSTSSVDDGGVGTSGTGNTGTGSTGTVGAGGASGTSGTGSTGTGTTPATIDCFGETCDAATELCCADMSSTGCQSLDAPCFGLQLHCTDASACDAGQVCCAHGFGPGGGDPIAKCEDTCGGGMGKGFQLCSTDAECLNGEPCTEGPGGILRCGGGGPGGGPGGGG